MAHIALSPAQDNAVTWLEKVDLPKTAKPVAQISGSLKPAQLTLIPLAYAVATGNSAQLDTAIDQGLAAGLTVSELTEAISHQFAYIGAPKTLNGVAALQKSLEVRKAQGIRDPQGKSATDLGNADYYALGTQTLAELSQAPTSRPIFDFAPALDYAIKAQLFGYQFARDNLAAQGKAVNGQLRSHLRVLKNLGAGDEQMAQILAALEKAAGKAVAENMRTVWREVQQ